MWIFGDTLIGKERVVNGDTPRMVRNSIGVSTCDLDFRDGLQCFQIDDGHRIRLAIARKSAAQIGRKGDPTYYDDIDKPVNIGPQGAQAPVPPPPGAAPAPPPATAIAPAPAPVPAGPGCRGPSRP